MKIDRISIRHLKTHGNYENTAVELSAEVDPGEPWANAFAELNDMVLLKVAQAIEKQRAIVDESALQREKSQLENDCQQYRDELFKMQEWKEANHDFVRLYEQMTGRSTPNHWPF